MKANLKLFTLCIYYIVSNLTVSYYSFFTYIWFGWRENILPYTGCRVNFVFWSVRLRFQYDYFNFLIFYYYYYFSLPLQKDDVSKVRCSLIKFIFVKNIKYINYTFYLFISKQNVLYIKKNIFSRKLFNFYCLVAYQKIFLLDNNYWWS